MGNLGLMMIFSWSSVTEPPLLLLLPFRNPRSTGSPPASPTPTPEVPMCLQQNQTPPPSQSPVQLSQELAEGNCGPHGVIADGDPKAMWDREESSPTRRLQI